MAGAPAGPGPRQPRRGPAPFASFDHDVSDESSPESKQTFQLPEIREDPAGTSSNVEGLAPPEQRARSHSSPAVAAGAAAAVAAGGALKTPAAPRIDISRASSSSHHDSRDSSPEMALFAGTAEDADTRGRLELGFREDGALELRSSTEELAFLEGAPGEPRAPPAPAPPAARRHSRKDSQGSEAALLGVSGRTSRLSSVGSQCSAHSALSGFSHASRVSRLSVVSGTSRSPSPHKMLLETSFCGPKPIETESEICAAAVEERLLQLACAEPVPAALAGTTPPPPPANTRDRREVRTEVTVENARPAARSTPAPRPAPTEQPVRVAVTPAEEKREKETRNRARVGRSKERRDSSEPEVYRNRNRSKDIIRIKLKPDDEYEDDDEEESERTLTGVEARRKPATLDLGERHEEPAPAPAASPTPSRRRTPSPAGAVSRKSSFCSLFKSRETIASPDSPSNAVRRKKSLTEGRSRSKSRDRDRSATPTSAAKIRGSVLSLFKTPRRSGASPSPNSRAASPSPAPAPVDHAPRSAEKLKYYEDSRNGVIHIPLRTPPDERAGPSGVLRPEPESSGERRREPQPARPASAPQLPRTDRPEPLVSTAPAPAHKPVQRTVLPDGSIIIPLHSPTERTAPCSVPDTVTNAEPSTNSDVVTPDSKRSATTPDSKRSSVTTDSKRSVATPDSRRSVVTPESRRSVVTSESKRSIVTPESRAVDECKNGDLRTESSSDDSRTGEPTLPEPPAPESERARRKQRLVFTTHVGSREQVFSTQFSITKTPSVTSEISGSMPSFHEPAAIVDEPAPPPLRDTHITCASPAPAPSPSPAPVPERSPSEARLSSGAASPGDAPRDSSGSEPSSGAATPAARAGSDAEQRGLVVQESFEEELPYVPTTLPMERSLVLPMVPVRERATRVSTAGVRRPRGTPLPPCPPPAPPAPAVPETPQAEKLRIKLPRRPRAASASAPPRPERSRTRSGGDGESKAKTEWIDFEEVPERRKQPKRIQTLPAAAGASAGVGAGGAAGGRDVVFSYVEPEQCRCECHAAARREGDGAGEGAGDGAGDGAGECWRGGAAPEPFVADFDLRAHEPDDAPPRPGSRRR